MNSKNTREVPLKRYTLFIYLFYTIKAKHNMFYRRREGLDYPIGWKNYWN